MTAVNAARASTSSLHAVLKAIEIRFEKDFIVRVREPFTVYPWLLESGRVVW
jgi:hypothetical protein